MTAKMVSNHSICMCPFIQIRHIQSEKDSTKEIERIFNLFDTETKGFITFVDLKRVTL